MGLALIPLQEVSMTFHYTTKALAVTGLLASALASAYAHPARCSGQGGCEDAAAVNLPAAAQASQEAAPVKACPAGYSRIGTTLCMTGALGPDSFANAMAVCQSLGGSVANYGAWRYRILFGDG